MKRLTAPLVFLLAATACGRSTHSNNNDESPKQPSHLGGENTPPLNPEGEGGSDGDQTHLNNDSSGDTKTPPGPEVDSAADKSKPDTNPHDLASVPEEEILSHLPHVMALVEHSFRPSADNLPIGQIAEWSETFTILRKRLEASHNNSYPFHTASIAQGLILLLKEHFVSTTGCEEWDLPSKPLSELEAHLKTLPKSEVQPLNFIEILNTEDRENLKVYYELRWALISSKAKYFDWKTGQISQTAAKKQLKLASQVNTNIHIFLQRCTEELAQSESDLASKEADLQLLKNLKDDSAKFLNQWRTELNNTKSPKNSPRL